MAVDEKIQRVGAKAGIEVKRTDSDRGTGIEREREQ